MIASTLEATATAGQLKRIPVAHEYKLVSLRECPLPETLAMCDQPGLAAQYWREHVTKHPAFKEEQADCMEWCPG